MDVTERREELVEIINESISKETDQPTDIQTDLS